MKHIGLFEGIGGFSLAARWMGWETVAWCEWNDFGQRVLRHHFPEAIGHGDITKTDFTPYANKIDILTGGFPCQPYSAAGKRRGKDDDRHLWPQMLRAIREIAPRFVVGENVLGLVNWNGGLVFDEVQADLEAEGYEVAPVVIPAAAVNAPHGRDRIWFIAYSGSTGSRNKSGTISNEGRRTSQDWSKSLRHTYGQTSASGVNSANSHEPTPDTDNVRLQQRTDSGEIRTGQRKVCTAGREPSNASETNGKERPTPDTDSDGQHQRHSGDEIDPGQRGVNAQRYFNSTPSNFANFPTQPPVCGGNDGLPRQLDGITFSKWRAESIKAYGNAIVPQVAYELFKAIELYESQPLS